MDNVFKNYLFTKQIIIGSESAEHPAEVLFLLAKYYGVKIVDGESLACDDLVIYMARSLGENVPLPFYKGFPDSVKALTKSELSLDATRHYLKTYGEKNFDEAGHSLLEPELERAAFAERTDIKKFTIVTEENAKKLIFEFLDDMLKSTRPLSDVQFEVLTSAIKNLDYNVKSCASKNTAIRLILSLRETTFAKFINLSDVVKLVEILDFNNRSRKANVKKLNLKNKNRKFISALIDEIVATERADVLDCYEKRAIWCGLLHHIHYKPKSKAGEEFAAAMRGGENRSVYSLFEKAMAGGDVKGAADILLKYKGSGALLRNLNYILSRCKVDDETLYVLNLIDADKPIILLQLLYQYSLYKRGARVFRFYRYNMLATHLETVEESSSRKSLLSAKTVDMLLDFIRGKIKNALSGKLGKVYIDEKMYDVALPLQENTTSGGFGVMPKGSRIHIGAEKKVRAFIYWEKVNDIDLSAIGLTGDIFPEEFSWQTMTWKEKSETCAITFSGDQTAGFNGGSEYFDVDLPLFRKAYPKVKYLVFCANVYSFSSFKDCVCRAGYMLRDMRDSGEAFEPKTVKSSFSINCDGTFAYLFGIDVKTGDFVWLNSAAFYEARVAAKTDMSFIADYFEYTKIMSLGSLFETLATEITDNAGSADIVLSDKEHMLKDGAEQIHSFDLEKVLAILS